jgi:hypothetical protein
MADATSIEPVSLDELRENSSRSKSRSIPLVIIVGAAVATAFVLNSTPLQSANDRSRWCSVYSLVENGTWQIDEIDSRDGWSTIDKVRHEGHFYSSKPAFLQALVAGVYWCVKQATGWTLLSDTEETTRAILVIVNLIPIIVSWFLLNGMLVRYAREKYTKRLLLLAFIFATPITTFLVTLNNHVVAAWSLTFALWAALKVVVDDRQSAGWFLTAGFFAAFTFVNELPALSFLALLGLLLLWKSPRRTLVWFLPAALVPIVAAAVLTHWQTGGWKPFYAYYGTDKYVYIHEGIPSYWANPKALDKNADSFPVYLLHCTFGHHGIFSLTPLFVLMPLAWIVPAWSDKRFRWIVWMSGLLTVVVLGFYLSRTGNYNYGGNTSTLRWLMWLIPMWIISLIPVLDRFADARTMHIVAGLFLGVGCFSTYWSIGNPWTAPWMYSLLDRYELLDQYKDPVPPLDRTHYVWFSKLPESFNAAAPASIELTCYEYTGRKLSISLVDRGREGVLQTVELRQNFDRDVPDAVTLIIDREKFRTGDKIEDWLIEPSSQMPDLRNRVMLLLRGLPKSYDFDKGRIRYLRTPLRTDAFTVHHAAERVQTRIQETGPLLWYRCDTWYCDDLPFGVAQVKFTVTRANDNVVISEQLFRVESASSYPEQATLKPADKQ